MNNESATLEKHPLLIIFYKGHKGDHVLKSFKRGMRKMLPNSVKPRVAFTGRNVGRSFQIVYCNKCAEEQCNENCICETGKRISNHAGRNSKSYIYKHCIETGHRSPGINKTIGSNLRKNVFKRKIPKALLIKQFKPILNKQEKSIELPSRHTTLFKSL